MTLELKLDTARPDSFTGKNKDAWLPWISSVLRVFKAKPTLFEDETSRVTYALSFLREAAASHYDNLTCQEDATGIENAAIHEWDAFVQEFQARFGIFDPMGHAQTRLDKIWQLQNEDFVSFIIRWEELAYCTGYNEHAMINQLRKSVASWLDMNISSQPQRPTTLTKWIHCYQELDASWHQNPSQQNRTQQGGLPGFLPQSNTWSAMLPPPLQFQNLLTGETQTSNWYVPRRNLRAPYLNYNGFSAHLQSLHKNSFIIQTQFPMSDEKDRR